MQIVLGSGSKARQSLLKSMGYDFHTLVSGVDEKAIWVEDPYQLPLMLAQAKAQELKRRVDDHSILITAESIALYDGVVREKPETEDQAKEFLRSYGDKPAEIITAVLVTNVFTGKSAQGVETALVYFHKIPETVIDELVKMGGVMYAAGGFMIEDPTIRKYIVHVEGGVDTVMGLPKMLTQRLINQVSSGGSISPIDSK